MKRDFSAHYMHLKEKDFDSYLFRLFSQYSYKAGADYHVL